MRPINNNLQGAFFSKPYTLSTVNKTSANVGKRGIGIFICF